MASDLETGAFSASANEINAAETELRSVIDAAPHSENAYEAHDILANMYSRNGLYRSALEETEAALRERPTAADPKSMLPILTVLGNFPAMSVIGLQETTLRIEPRSKSLPVKINGQAAEFLFDTGANISVIGATEAKALGLETVGVNGNLGDASGRGVSALKAVLANDLSIGGLHLRNVPFLVVPDSEQPWSSLPLRNRGIIGIPVLLAMRTLEWKVGGLFAFGFSSRPLELSACNVLFYNSTPVVNVQVDHKYLNFTLDTGAISTDLNPPFAKAFPDLMRRGRKEQGSIQGLGGESDGASILLPSVTLGFGGGKVQLTPARVFTVHGNGTWAAGNMGTDVLGKGSGFKLDFGAMTLQLE